MRDKLAAAGLVDRQERIGLGKLLNDYIEGRPSLKPNTVRNLRGSAKLLIGLLRRRQAVHRVSDADADNFREFLVSKKYSPAHDRSSYQTGSTILYGGDSARGGRSKPV